MSCDTVPKHKNMEQLKRSLERFLAGGGDAPNIDHLVFIRQPDAHESRLRERREGLERVVQDLGELLSPQPGGNSVRLTVARKKEIEEDVRECGALFPIDDFVMRLLIRGFLSTSAASDRGCTTVARGKWRKDVMRGGE
ncbi:hypothetical protein MKZ38_008700 [Zalerion maritima]|uniref:Uncharacterized protein n=1 Tax=Zalerion maritima TaxID=339359 RepID=A0AAD5WMK8_9PEZI|nr:hypothetical protein MKZ38_008700 [Zalerion maritima]